MKGLLEVDDALATLAKAGSEVLANLPVHGSLQSILDSLRTAL